MKNISTQLCKREFVKQILLAGLLMMALSLSSPAYATDGWQGWYRGHAPELVFATPTYIEVVF